MSGKSAIRWGSTSVNPCAAMPPSSCRVSIGRDLRGGWCVAARNGAASRAVAAGVGCAERSGTPAQFGRGAVSRWTCAKYGESAHQLLHPVVDAGDSAQHRGQALLGDLRHHHVWVGVILGALVSHPLWIAWGLSAC
jgi:hypothetical protein